MGKKVKTDYDETLKEIQGSKKKKEWG